MFRRDFLAQAFGASFGAALASNAGFPLAALQRTRESTGARLEGRLKQSVSRWCYGGIKLEALCEAAAAMGLKSVELLDENEWAVPKKFGLTCAMPNGPGGIGKGWNRVAHHDELVAKSERLLPLIKDAGFPNMIVFSGNRAGISEEEGVANTVAGLKRIAPLAEKLKITLCIEYLNSRVDHKDYQFDRMDFGLSVCKGVGSERVKILFDIYHVQIMEGDIIRRIKDHIGSIGHFHTGGVPGRHELDETQELNYSAVAKAIADAGFQGYVGHEFVPTRDPLTSLREAVKIFDV